MQLTDVKLAQAATGPVTRKGIQVIAVTSAYPGTGKSDFCFNLAVSLAGFGEKVALFNADFLNSAIENRFQDVDDRMHADSGMVFSPLKSEQFLSGEVHLARNTSHYELLSEPDLLECVSFIRAFDADENRLSHLLIDTSSNLSTCSATLCAAASQVIVLVTGTMTDCRDSVALIERLYNENAVQRFHIVASRVGSAAEGERLFENMIALLESNHNIVVSYDGYIPEDAEVDCEKVRKEGLWSAMPRSRASMAIRRMAETVCAWPHPTQAGGHIEFFVERLIAYK